MKPQNRTKTKREFAEKNQKRATGACGGRMKSIQHKALGGLAERLRSGLQIRLFALSYQRLARRNTPRHSKNEARIFRAAIYPKGKPGSSRRSDFHRSAVASSTIRPGKRDIGMRATICPPEYTIKVSPWTTA